MKKYLFIVLLVWGWSCAPTPTFIPKVSEINAVDFTPFTEKGFLFTPNKYTQDYESIGIINFTYFPEANLIEKKIKRGKDEKDDMIVKFWDIEKFDINLLLYEVYTASIQMGADALTEFSIKSVSSNHALGSSYPVSINGIQVYGFAIKRNK